MKPLWLLYFATLSAAWADETAIRAAITRSVPLIEQSSIIAIRERSNCFTCHHTGLPVVALLTAAERGFTVDSANLKTQLQFTADFIARGRDNYLQGRGQGGQALTAGFALWTLKHGSWKADATTEAVTGYLLGHQEKLRHWSPPSIRPPSEESPFAATYFALEGIRQYRTAGQQERADARISQARDWLLETPAQHTEDRVFRLWALHSVDAETKSAAKELLTTQREDGGWAQLDGMASDAYATGSALVALHSTKSLTPADPAYQRGLQWLIQAQLPDGSWHVATRSKPIQEYYESGYPHGKDQFISITAAAWATIALALALPPTR